MHYDVIQMAKKDVLLASYAKQFAQPKLLQLKQNLAMMGAAGQLVMTLI
jgi:hypothetical protein